MQIKAKKNDSLMSFSCHYMYVEIIVGVSVGFRVGARAGFRVRVRVGSRVRVSVV